MEVSRATNSQQMYAVQQEAAPAEDADMTEAEFEQQFMDSIFKEMLLDDSPFEDLN